MTYNKLCFYISILLGLILSGCYSGESTLMPRPPYVPKELEESYKLNVNPKVDIVFVVDDSGSMSSHQNNLAANMALFTGAMEKNKFLNYHIGTISTSTNELKTNGYLQGTPSFITKKTDLGLQKLQFNIKNIGTSGDATEKMFEPLYRGFVGLDSDLINPGFMREDAFFVVIFLTDAEDQSDNFSGYEVYEKLVKAKSGDVNKVLGYAALAHPSLFGDSCSQDGGEDPLGNEAFMSYFTNAYNSRISQGVQSAFLPNSNTLTNVFSLCDPQFGKKLANIGEDIRVRVSNKIPLPKLPVRGTIKLKYGKEYVDQKWWKYDPTTQSILLDKNIELPEGVAEDASFSVVLDQSDPERTIGVPPEDVPAAFEPEQSSN